MLNSLLSGNGPEWGEWQEVQYCPEGSSVCGIRTKVDQTPGSCALLECYSSLSICRTRQDRSEPDGDSLLPGSVQLYDGS